MSTNPAKNPVKDQDRVADLFDTFGKYGYAMFPQQRIIYRNIALRFPGGSMLEAGCGTGIGSVILLREGAPYKFLATDIGRDNTVFGSCIYPWIKFDVWDINAPWVSDKFDTVVCVECIEHIENPQAGIKNLIDAATREVWITTPNNHKAYSPPENPYHVSEFSVKEMLQMIFDAADYSRIKKVSLHHWETFEELQATTDVSPLVYHVQLKG